MNLVKHVAGRSSHYRLPLEGSTVSRVYLDHRFVLQFFGLPDDIDIAIACPFKLIDGAHASWVEPEKPWTVGPALNIVFKSVVSAIASDEGQLDIAFADGTRLVAPSNPDYEAWETTSAHGAKVVALPKGGLAIWDSGEPDDTRY